MIWRKENEIISLDVNAFISLYLRARQLPGLVRIVYIEYYLVVYNQSNPIKENLQNDPKIKELLLEADEKQFISLIPIAWNETYGSHSCHIHTVFSCISSKFFETVLINVKYSDYYVRHFQYETIAFSAFRLREFDQCEK